MNLPPCPHCGSSNTYTEERPPHIGLYCQQCGRWIKWLAQDKPLDTMPFGKYKGSAFNKLPADYLDWCSKNLTNVSDKLRSAIETEIQKRKATQ